MTKLGNAVIYQWSDVENFVKSYNDKKVKQATLANLYKPVVDCFNARYKEASQTLESKKANSLKQSLNKIIKRSSTFNDVIQRM